MTAKLDNRSCIKKNQTNKKPMNCDSLSLASSNCT